MRINTLSISKIIIEKSSQAEREELAAYIFPIG
jgi:hypothetical protein